MSHVKLLAFEAKKNPKFGSQKSDILLLKSHNFSET